jgi:hypothetical protein
LFSVNYSFLKDVDKPSLKSMIIVDIFMLGSEESFSMTHSARRTISSLQLVGKKCKGAWNCLSQGCEANNKDDLKSDKMYNKT